jgi:hypothetical protein
MPTISRQLSPDRGSCASFGGTVISRPTAVKIACSSGAKFGLLPVARSPRSTSTVGHHHVHVLPFGFVEGAIEVAQVVRIANGHDPAAR